MKIDVKKVKIIVMVPSENTQELRDAICTEGAGIIGNYSYCTTTTKSVGTFKPSKNANPYIGEKEKIEFVDEEKLEVVCDINIAKRVLNKIREVHPYEEPGIDIIPLLDEDYFNSTLMSANLPDVDLMIRTSGEQRLSNFMLWQLAYAEFVFTPVYWPDFDEKELHKAIWLYQNRDRRFGGLK